MPAIETSPPKLFFYTVIHDLDTNEYVWATRHSTGRSTTLTQAQACCALVDTLTRTIKAVEEGSLVPSPG